MKLNDEIEVEVVKVNDGEGNVLLSQRNIVNRKAWEALMEKFENNEYIDAVGKEAVKGGLLASVEGGIRAFVPASQLAQRYVEKIGQFVGQPMKLKIIDVDKQKKRIVASRKQVIEEESAAKKAAAWEKLTEGAVVKGIVRRFADFGAFVDLDGVDGLIHITDLAWNRVGHPSDVLQVNQEVEVKVLKLDRERERIQLGYKQLQPMPWDNIEEKYPVGTILERNVVRIRPFGAFIELEPGVDGLVHISQCALTRIAKVEDVLQVGQPVRVKVLAVDPEAKRISPDECVNALSARKSQGQNGQLQPPDQGDLLRQRQLVRFQQDVTILAHAVVRSETVFLVRLRGDRINTEERIIKSHGDENLLLLCRAGCVFDAIQYSSRKEVQPVLPGLDVATLSVLSLSAGPDVDIVVSSECYTKEGEQPAKTLRPFHPGYRRDEVGGRIRCRAKLRAKRIDFTAAASFDQGGLKPCGAFGVFEQQLPCLCDFPDWSRHLALLPALR